MHIASMPKAIKEKTVMVTLRMKKNLHHELKKRARAENRSLGNYASTLLAQAVAKPASPR